MEYFVGVLVGVGVAGLAAVSGMDRDRSFYPTVLIVIAAYYVLFAAMGASGGVVGIESAAASGFLALALLGFKKSVWLVAAAIAGHGVFDAVHHLFIQNPGVPAWWPGFCGSADVVLGGLALVRRRQCRRGTHAPGDGERRAAEIGLEVTSDDPRRERPMRTLLAFRRKPFRDGAIGADPPAT